MANVLVFGHQNPDNDAIMSAVVLSQLLNQVEYAGNTYEACALGQLPAESAKLLADAGIAEPRAIESVEAGQLVVLTDHNESAQSVAGLRTPRSLASSIITASATSRPPARCTTSACPGAPAAPSSPSSPTCSALSFPTSRPSCCSRP